LKDAGSSAGTFIQGSRYGDKPYRLSVQGAESSPFELHDGDLIQFGEDYHQEGGKNLFLFLIVLNFHCFF